MSKPDPLTPSAVILPVYRDGSGELRVVLVVRGPGGPHGGQLGLPGGKAEPEDASLLETALRETWEEIGLARSDIEVIAELEPLDTRSTGFRVHPFLARVPPAAAWLPRAGEIEGVLTPDAASILAPETRCRRELTDRTWPAPRTVDCVLVEGHVLWGLTLRLLDLTLPRALAGEWRL